MIRHPSPIFAKHADCEATVTTIAIRPVFTHPVRGEAAALKKPLSSEKEDVRSQVPIVLAASRRFRLNFLECGMLSVEVHIATVGAKLMNMTSGVEDPKIFGKLGALQPFWSPTNPKPRNPYMFRQRNPRRSYEGWPWLSS